MNQLFDFIKTIPTEYLILGGVAVVAVITLIIVLIASASKRKKQKRLKEQRTSQSAQASARESVTDESPAEAQESVEEEASAVIVGEVRPVERKIEIVTDEETQILRGIEAATGLAIIARYKKSYLARLIQSADETKEYYSALKNAALAFRKATARISWNHETVNVGRTKMVKFAVRGKTLCLFLALNPDEFAESKYKVERAEAAKHAETPCLYKISNPRRVKYAIELISLLAERLNLTAAQGEEVDYRMPYEDIEALIEKGLVKELISKENYEEFMRRRSYVEIDRNRRQFVSASEVDAIIADDIVTAIIVDERTGKGYQGKKDIVNIDELSRAFEAGETVNLQTLKERGIVAPSVGYVKVLARGTLDKPLSVHLQDYSLEAAKMIVLTGGIVARA